MNSIQIVRGIGRGEKPRRILPLNGLYLDPFLLLDHFWVQKPMGFPSHPHRGFEIITYVLEGALKSTKKHWNMPTMKLKLQRFLPLSLAKGFCRDCTAKKHWKT